MESLDKHHETNAEALEDIFVSNLFLFSMSDKSPSRSLSIVKDPRLRIGSNYRQTGDNPKRVRKGGRQPGS
jgi:hypothetical protein